MPSTALPAARVRPPAGSGFGLHVVEQLPDPLGAGVDRPAQEARARVDAVADVRPQRRLEALGLHEVEPQRGHRGVERPVEDHPPDALGEQLGVGRAEEGAVGRAEVAELRVAEHRPQDVDVLGRLDRGHVRGELAALLDAAVAELGDEPVGAAHLGLGVRVGVGRDEGVELAVREALHRGAAADAARVEARRCRRPAAARSRSRQTRWRRSRPRSRPGRRGSPPASRPAGPCRARAP